MEYHVQKNGAQGSLALEGEMTSTTAEETTARLLGMLFECNELEVNLSGVSKVDLAGQQVLVLAKLEAMIEHKTLRLVRHSPAVVQVIDSFGLTGFFGDPIQRHAQANSRS